MSADTDLRDWFVVCDVLEVQRRESIEKAIVRIRYNRLRGPRLTIANAMVAGRAFLTSEPWPAIRLAARLARKRGWAK